MSGALSIVRTIEEGGRRALFAPLVWLSRREWRPDQHSLRAHPLRVLFIAEDALGDTIVSVPAIRAIAESHPDTVVDVVTWEGPAAALERAPFIRHLIVFPKRDRRRLNAWAVLRRCGPYDVVVDGMVFHGHVRSRSLAMMIGSGARYWIGEAGRGSEWVLNIKRPHVDLTRSHVQRMLALVAPLTHGEHDGRPVLPVTDAELAAAHHRWNGDAGSPRVVVNVSTNGPERQWPMERIVAVARHVRSRAPDARMIVVGLERDRASMDRVAEAGEGIAPNLGVRQLMATIASSDLVISPDTAVCHIASAFERPLVSIHTQGFENFRPYRTPGAQIVGSSRESMEDIPVSAVLEAVDTVLADIGLCRSTATIAFR